MIKMINNINIQDVMVISRALIDTALESVSGDCGYQDYTFCLYCNNTLKSDSVDTDNFIHEEDCPVLTAKRLLGDI